MQDHNAVTFHQANDNWQLRIQTKLLHADVIPAQPLDLASKTAQAELHQRIYHWQSKGYVLEDASILAVFEQTCAQTGITNFTQDGLLNIACFPKLVDICRDGDSRYRQLRFAGMRNRKPGIYPIVDNLDHLAALLNAGAKIIQLRIKSDVLTTEIRDAIHRAVELAKQHPESQLFINDYWQAAIDAGAYGVHLGQEDLLTADLSAIANAGLRLGVSSHAFWEVARAITISPSYIACGPVFPTRAKAMPWIAQGLDNLRYWSALIPVPVVGIGGVNQDNLQAIHDTGCASASIIQAIVSAADPANAYRSLQRQWESFTARSAQTIQLARPTLAASTS